MYQHSHRGIYEHLWSEHKYSVMAVSMKSFTGMSTRLGKVPKLLAVIKRIAECAFEEKTANYDALLSVYMYIKDFITRKRQEEIVKAIMNDESQATYMIYEDAVKYDEKFLPGCRIFFNNTYGIEKFWDNQDKPGLWICLGPFQLHLTPQQVFNRMVMQLNMQPQDLLCIMKRIEKGISYDEFIKLPKNVVNVLRNNNAVAEPGEKKAWLHPRIIVDELVPKVDILEVPDNICYSGLLLETAIDKAEYPPELIGSSPSFEVFSEYFGSQIMNYCIIPENYDLHAAYNELTEAFSKRLAEDNGEKIKEETNNVIMEQSESDIYAE